MLNVLKKNHQILSSSSSEVIISSPSQQDNLNCINNKNLLKTTTPNKVNNFISDSDSEPEIEQFVSKMKSNKQLTIVSDDEKYDQNVIKKQQEEQEKKTKKKMMIFNQKILLHQL